MKTNISILTLAFMSGFLSLSAQDIQDRQVAPFQRIESAGSVNVIYTNSDTLSLGVKCKASEAENIHTRVENGTLFINNKGTFAGPVYVYVKHNQLKQLQASGATAFKVTNTLKADTLSLSISGSANVRINTTALKIKSVQSGASYLTLGGTADNFSAELSGASSLQAYGLVSKNTDIVATGASTSKIYVTEKLKANATGASNIKVRGEVTDISAEASSASSISKIVDKKADASDSTFYNWRGRKIIIIDREKDGENIANSDSTPVKHFDNDDFKHWSGISFGVNGYMHSPGNLQLPAADQYMNVDYAHSFNFQFNIIERQFNLVRNNVKIITGFGIDYHSYELSNNTRLNPDSSFTGGVIDSSGLSYKKNRLRNTYLQVPLLIEFNTSNDPYKTFHLALGVIGEYMVASRTKQVIEQNGDVIKRVHKDNYNMSPFMAKAHVNFGYRGWTIYAEYNLTPLFQSNKGPELYPFTVGLRVIPFT